MGTKHPKALSRRSFLRFTVGGAAIALLNACTPAQPTAPTATVPAGDAGTPSAAAPTTAPSMGTPQAPLPGAGPVTLGFATTTASTGEDEMWRVLSDAFTEENPDIIVDMDLVPGSNWERLRIMVQSGTAKDVMNVSDDDAYLMGDSGRFLTIEDVISDIDQSLVAPAAWQTFEVNARPYFISPVFRTTIAIYNRALFAEAGITNIPTTWDDAWEWDEFVEYMRQLTRDTNGDGRPDQYGFGGNYSLSVLWPFSNGGSGPYNEDQTQCRMDAPDVVEAYQAFQDLIHREGVMSPAIENPDLYALFNAGRLGMMYTSGAEFTSLTPDVDWDVIPLPKMKVSAPTENFGRPFGISADSPNPEAAKMFLSFLLSERGQQIMVDYQYGNPVHRAAAEYFASGPEKPPTKSLYFDGLQRDIDLQNVNPLGEQWVELFVRRGAREILAGGVDVQQYLEEKCDEMDAFIQSTGWRRPQ